MILFSKDYINEQVENTKSMIVDFELNPTLAIIVAKGFSEPSSRYVKNKHILAQRIGINVKQYDLEWQGLNSDEFTFNLEQLIKQLNDDDSIHGIIVQLPVPFVEEDYIANLISPFKDVDGFHPYNLGQLVRGSQIFTSCTPKGVVDFLDWNNIDVCGKKVCIVGRSNIVGKPLANLMTNAGATVIHCNSKTQGLEALTNLSDIVILATGQPKYFDTKYFNQNSIVIDVGINFDENGKICGDASFDELCGFVKHITPVPGGVGPLTVLSLMINTVKASYILKK